jgi:dTDP-4-amino-4,6-dideoxygalactose transaminase
LLDPPFQAAQKRYAKVNLVGAAKAMILFNQPSMVGRELENIEKAIASQHLRGDGPLTHDCQALIAQAVAPNSKVLLTHSCTAALEMCALLAEVKSGDEVIMPSYTFVSTANAVVLRGGVPVFVDVEPDTMNISARTIEAAISSKTKAICVVHYAGVAVDMDPIMELARAYRLATIEDAAQAYHAAYKGRPCGGLADLGAFSFHETKNIISGEGGALVVNAPALAERSEILWEKGTNRKQFLQGAVDKYTWVDVGSSFLPSELVAAFLKPQLEASAALTHRRLDIWDRYHRGLESLEKRELLRRPIVPAYATHNAHMYFVLLPDAALRQPLLSHLRTLGVGAAFHYVPLHSAPAGLKYARTAGAMDVTNDQSARLMRLPLHASLTDADVDRVIESLTSELMKLSSGRVRP